MFSVELPPATMAASVAAAAKMDPLVGRSLASRYSDWIFEALEELPGNFLISDPCIAGHPIVFASRGFLGMSGYAREEVIGRNGRIFQGPATNRRAVIEIREAIRAERTMQINILNYRKDGSPIWILFHLCPVFGRDDGQVIHFVAVQVPISRRASVGPRQGLDCTGGGTGFFVGTCRKEMRGEVELGRNLAVDSFVDSDNRGLEAEESCGASDVEKQNALDASNAVLSTLTHYSELTGKIVCRTRHVSFDAAPLPSSLHISLGRIKQSFVLTDPQLFDMPIIYASDAFLSLTGYTRHEVLGRNCRLLNGADTDLQALQQIKESIGAAKACTVRVLNYRKDGSTFRNRLLVSPVRNASGKIAFHVWVQMDEEAAKVDEQGLSPEMKQLGAVGAVKVAVRSLSAAAGPSSRT
uniref:Putative LOV domain-containing protein n=1 Tax=Pistia stratiotes TaxID=4477 RepID=A0A126WZD1_PISST|nr:putative LOV domain-containing protein [Pistia stratiotes]